MYTRKVQILQNVVHAVLLVCIMDSVQKASSIPVCPWGALGHVLGSHEDSDLYPPVRLSLELDC